MEQMVYDSAAWIGSIGCTGKRGPNLCASISKALETRVEQWMSWFCQIRRIWSFIMSFPRTLRTRTCKHLLFSFLFDWDTIKKLYLSAQTNEQNRSLRYICETVKPAHSTWLQTGRVPILPPHLGQTLPRNITAKVPGQLFFAVLWPQQGWVAELLRPHFTCTPSEVTVQLQCIEPKYILLAWRHALLAHTAIRISLPRRRLDSVTFDGAFPVQKFKISHRMHDILTLRRGAIRTDCTDMKFRRMTLIEHGVTLGFLLQGIECW